MVRFKSNDRMAQVYFEISILNMFDDIFIIENQTDYEETVDFILETVVDMGNYYAGENDDVHLEPYQPI
ncbi:MAG: hypothetical protein J6V44_09570 [Methanobrevibacter sp.]|nr:hypothetical protein [Methanobrevibacter sp.]